MSAAKPPSKPAAKPSTHELGVDPETLWQSPDKLRGSIDAAEYKHVVLGLVFLTLLPKLISGVLRGSADTSILEATT